MVIEAQLADGTILEFPDGTTDAVIQQTVKRQLGVQSQPIEQPSGVAAKDLLLGDIPAPQQPLEQAPAQEDFKPRPAQGILSGTTIPQQEGGITAEGIKESVNQPEVFQAALGTVGTALGMGLGPAGMIGGGALGTAAGEALYNAINPESPSAPQDMAEVFQQPFDAGLTDLAVGSGLAGVGQILRGIKPVTGKFLGAKTEEAKIAKQQADSLGIPANIIQTTPSQAVKGFSQVIGIFPFVGNPIKESQRTAQTATLRVADDILNELAPTATINSLGTDLTKFAKRRYDGFRRLSGALYKNVENKTAQLADPNIFTSANTKEAANQLASAREKELVQLQSGGKLEGLKNNPLADYISDLRKLPEELSLQQLRGIAKNLGEIAAKAASDGFATSQAIIIKKAVEKDINAIARIDKTIDPDTAKEITEGLQRANRFFSENVKKFQSPTAKKFQRVDKNIFKPKFDLAGTREADEIFKAVFNSKSPESLRSLRELIGVAPFKKAVRGFLDDAMDKSFKVGTDGEKIIAPARFKKSLGLDTEDGKAALEEMFKGTKVTVKKLSDLADVIDSVGSVPVPNTSQFVARRVALAGAATVLGGGLLANPVTTITLSLLAKNASRFLSDPKILDDVIRGINPDISKLARNNAALRLIRLGLTGEEQQAAQQLIKENK